MQNWEYLTVSCYQDYENHRPKFHNSNELPNWKKNPAFPEYLNELGMDGWELVSAFPMGQMANLIKLILKRPKQ